MKIKKAWYVPQLPTYIVAELPDSELVMFRLTPFRSVTKEECIPYLGHHPYKTSGYPVPHYVLKHYGLEATVPEGVNITGITIAEAERLYGLPNVTIRRDILRGKFELGTEVDKVGNVWFITREALKRQYGGVEMSKARSFLTELEQLDKQCATAAYHGNLKISEDQREKYIEMYYQEIEKLRKKYGLVERLVEILPNGIGKYDLVCDDGSIAGSNHDELCKLDWEETTYDAGFGDCPAIYLKWEQINDYLGEPHEGDSDQDELIIKGLLLQGAPEWVKDAAGWVDEYGWGLYNHEQ